MVAPTDTLERALLGMLLAGDEPTLAVLRAQLEGCHLGAREREEDGFTISIDVAENMPVVPGEPKLRIDDVTIEIPGLEHGAGCILWIARGRLFSLEVFSFAEPWPIEVRAWKLGYVGSARVLQLL